MRSPATGLSPLAVVALFSGLLLGEAAIEMTRAPAAERVRPPQPLPHETRRARGT